ncbi:MAG: SUMF1/EgtB/PvdO family nonheme iron enzyme, partial [Planctomycetota bacterium]
GGFTFNANYLGDGNEVTQETAIALLALNEYDRSGYLDQIRNAACYLALNQLVTGGWEDYLGDGEMNLHTGQALWAIASAQRILPVNSAGADRLIDLQNNDGGWDNPLDDGNKNVGTDANNLGSTAEGLAYAYSHTLDTNTLNALNLAGSLLMSKTDRFTVFDGTLAVKLDEIFQTSQYSDYVIDNFYDPLDAGTYYDAFTAATHDSNSFVQSIQDSFTDANSNLAAFYCGLGLYSSDIVDANTDYWIPAVKQEVNELDAAKDYDVLGLAGAILGLAQAGIDCDPDSGQHASAENIDDLASILAGYQLSSGGFTFNANYIGDGNETTQETIYALLAMQAYDRPAYLQNIRDAGRYLQQIQLGTGGWENYPGDIEQNLLTGESLWAFNVASPLRSPRLVPEGITITGQVELQNFAGSNREVTFTATGGTETKTWVENLAFTGTTASFSLSDVPAGTKCLSAKTNWNLQRTVAVSMISSSQYSADLTGAKKLLGGDINNSNSINILDYTLLKINWNTTNSVADINGDGQVQTLDYSLMKANWFQVGDDQCPCVPDDMAYIPDGEFEMGDHHGDGYPDEQTLHAVLLDAFFMGKYEISNQQYCDYLNSAYPGQIKVVSGVV